MKLIINADDFGLEEDVNEAIDICLKKDSIQRTTLMVNMPYSHDAAVLAHRNQYEKKVGLHINLIEGQPLTESIKKTLLCNKNGNFNGMFFKKITNRFYINKNTKKAIEQEIEAQIKKYFDMGMLPTHIDSHQHSHVNISILKIVLKLAKKYDFKSIRLARNMPLKKISLTKQIYKKVVNNKIIKYNMNKCDINNKQFFGSKADCEIEDISKNIYYDDAFVEMMVHPIIRNGFIIDHYTTDNLFDIGEFNI